VHGVKAMVDVVRTADLIRDAAAGKDRQARNDAV
jgi:hypothetical protein